MVKSIYFWELRPARLVKSHLEMQMHPSTVSMPETSLEER